MSMAESTGRQSATARPSTPHRPTMGGPFSKMLAMIADRDHFQHFFIGPVPPPAPCPSDCPALLSHRGDNRFCCRTTPGAWGSRTADAPIRRASGVCPRPSPLCRPDVDFYQVLHGPWRHPAFRRSDSLANFWKPASEAGHTNHSRSVIALTPSNVQVQNAKSLAWNSVSPKGGGAELMTLTVNH